MTVDHTLSGAYALDALPDNERAEFEEHLESCESCPQEVRELQATGARLASAAAISPPAALQGLVMARIATVRQLPPIESAPARAADESQLPPAWTSAARRYRTRAPLALAASVLLIATLALGAVTLVQQRRLDSAQEANRAIAAVVADPDRTLQTGEPSTGGSASAIAAGGRAVFAASDLAPLPDDRDYQLWVLDGAEVRSVGVLDVEDGLAQVLVESVGADSQLAVSVEPNGGSEQPTTTPIIVLPLA